MLMSEGTRTVARSSFQWGGLVNELLTIGVVTLTTLYHDLNQEVKSMKSSLMSETNQVCCDVKMCLGSLSIQSESSLSE